MRPARRRRTIEAVALSVAVHVAVLAALALYVPKLVVFREPGGPPQAIIPVLIMPKAPPKAAEAGAKPAPIRLHRRRQRFALTEPPPVAPLVVPVTPAPKAAPSEAPRPAPAPQPDAMTANARNALRGAI